jgi:hypothetical protein
MEKGSIIAEILIFIMPAGNKIKSIKIFHLSSFKLASLEISSKRTISDPKNTLS